jgi:hypothetical protein
MQRLLPYASAIREIVNFSGGSFQIGLRVILCSENKKVTGVNGRKRRVHTLSRRPSFVGHTITAIYPAIVTASERVRVYRKRVQ